MAVAPKQNSLQTLKKLIPLNLLPEADLEQLLKTAAFKQDRAGTYLFRQGDTDYHNIYLLSGKVALLDNMREVDRVAAGSETARFPLAHQIPRKNSARAIGVVEYVLIDNRKLSEMLVRNKDDDYKVADLSSTISDDWMDQLLQSKVFQQIPPSNIQGVIMRMEEVEVKRGEKVVEQGGEGDYFYLIHQGRCTVSRLEDGKKKPTELAKLGPGDSFGEEALLSDSPRNSTVTMLTKGILLRLAKEDFIQFVKRPLARGVSFEEADALVAKGAVWLDVRSPVQYAAGHLEHSVSFPLDTLRYQAPNLALDQKYVICCDDGHLSSTAAYLLTDRGFVVSVLEGGLRTAPPDLMVKEKPDTESSAKVISLHPGEEIADDKTHAKQQDDQKALQQQLAAANSRIKDLGVKFQTYRDRHKKEEAKQLAEIKAQKIIIDKNRIRLDELRMKRDADRRLIEQLQQESGELNTSIKEATEKLSQAQKNIVDLEARLQGAQDTKQSAAAEKDEHRKELEALRDRLEDASAEKAALEGKIERLQSGQGDAKQKQDEALEDLKQQIKQLQVDLDEAREITQSGQADLKKSQEASHAMQSELDKLRKANREIQDELNESREASQTVQDELNQAQERYLELQSEMAEVRGALRDKESELERSLAKTDRQGDEDTDALHEEIKTLTEALAESDLAYDQIREQAEALAKEKEQIQQKMRELEQNRSQDRPKPARDDRRTSIEREVFGDVDEDLVSKGLDMVEEESLRQELEDLRNASSNWEQRLNEAEEKCRALDDALEDRDKEIDQIRLELDEGKARLVESEEQRQQSDATINQLRELAASGKPVNEYVDSRLTNPPAKTLHIDNLISGHSPGRAIALWALLGAGICFAVLDGLMIYSGRGELLSGMLQNGEEQQIGPMAVERNGIDLLASSRRNSPFITNDSKIGANTVISAKEKDQAVKTESSWTVLKDISFGPTMVRLNGGNYTMGSNRNQVSSDQWPAHNVEIKSFAISQTEITFDDYDRFAKETGRRLPDDQGWGRGSRPVVDVSWDDAVAYTKWLSQRTGRTYRLPSESEWEYAIRSGSDSTYWWGYQMEEGRANCFDCGSEWDRKSTAPAASFPPNNFGLYDMAGNVREWVMDCYRPNYSGAPQDGTAWLERGCNERVARGGAYNKTSDSMRSVWRGRFKPNLRFSFTGFRVVLEL